MYRFADKFEGNANLQLRKLNRAIDLYIKDIYKKARNIRYVSRSDGYDMMQPLALRNFAEAAFVYLEPLIGYEEISMFTIIVDKYNFGQNDWNFQYKRFQKDIKKLLKGFDYIANVALDEFPRSEYEEDGKLMTPHIHGIFFRPLSRWEKGKLSVRIKKYFPNCRMRPFVVREHFDLESALQYVFKALFGGKNTYVNKKYKLRSRNVETTYKSIFINYIHLKRFKIYDLAFAGGKGKEALENIINEISH